MDPPPGLGFLLRLFLLRLCVWIHPDAAEGGGVSLGRPRPLLACSPWRRALAPPPSGCFLLAFLQRPLDPDGAALQLAAVQFERQLDGVGALREDGVLA